MILRSAGSRRQLQFDPEIELSTKKKRKQAQRARKEQAKTMAEAEASRGGEESAGSGPRKTLGDYAMMGPEVCVSSIVRPVIDSPAFVINPQYIHLIKQDQFSGAAHEDAAEHIQKFLAMLDFFKIQGASEEAIRMRMFPLSLTGKAFSWVHNQAPGSLSTWEVLVRKFVDKFFPAGRQAKLRQDVNSFVQEDGEPLHEAWERFNQLLKKCPTHSIPDWMQIRLFYDGLKMSNKGMIDAAAGGSLNKKTLEEAKEIIETMAYNSSQAVSERSILRNTDLGTTQVQTLIQQNREMQQQISALAKQMGQTKLAAAVQDLVCDFCQGNHRNGECAISSSGSGATEEQVNFIGRGQKGNTFSNNYNQGYRNHPNFSWHSPALNPPEKQPWEVAIEKLAQVTQSAIEEVRATLANQSASIRNLEVQVGQLAKQISERFPGTFPGDTVTNPKERCMAVTLRSGKSYEEPLRKDTKGQAEGKKEKPKPAGDRQSTEEPKETQVPPAEHNQKKDKEKTTQIPLRVPFPQRLKKQEDQRNFSKFMEMFRKLQINIPFAEALEQAPLYAKYMKELMTKKKRMLTEESFPIAEKCSSIIQKRLPSKQKDPGSFALPFQIGKDYSGKSLCDLGASVNIMPLSVYAQLDLGEAKPTMATLQLADKSILRPYGVVEDILVKVDKFILPMDFLILDIEEDDHIPLIFGRPFLATAGAVIDVPRGEVILRVSGEQTVIPIFEKPPSTAEYFSPIMCIQQHHEKAAEEDDDLKDKASALWGYLATP